MARQPADHTLQATALVNEVYLHLADARHSDWRDCSHFLAACAQIMRRILVDHARAQMAAKRGGGVQTAALEEAWIASTAVHRDAIAVDEGLDSLAAVDPRKARVVELRFFGGLSIEETAAVLGVSEETVKRDWRLARLWLAREILKDQPHGPGPLGKD